MENSNRPVRVRFAPSPTGPLHIGGVRTALYNYLFAKKNNGKFIIRIEDTDAGRFVAGAEKYILESLSWAGISHDEGPDIGGPFSPYKQSERKYIYHDYVGKLIASGHAYYAFDTVEELEAMRARLQESKSEHQQYGIFTRGEMRNSLTVSAEEVKERLANNENYVVRAKIPENEIVQFTDLIRGEVSVNSNELDDKILYKSDGMPTYHLANIVDDFEMKISHVIRGEEWLPSAPLHVLLYRFFGWENVMPQFAHLPLLLRPDGKGKLSKRDGDKLGFPVFLLDWTDPNSGEKSTGFRERGFFPEAFVNMLALLGWHPGDSEQEIFSRDELIKNFSIDKIQKSGARFDFEKAKWFNHEYLIKKSGEELLKDFSAVLMQQGRVQLDNDFDEGKLIQICNILKMRCNFVNEFWENGYYFFQKPIAYDEGFIKKKWGGSLKSFFQELIQEINQLIEFDASSVDLFLHNFITEKQMKAGDVLPVLRIMLIGMKTGPGVNEVISVLEKNKTIERVEIAIPVFDKMTDN
jgi:glutamyl-tRNA synthetase